MFIYCFNEATDEPVILNMDEIFDMYPSAVKDGIDCVMLITKMRRYAQIKRDKYVDEGKYYALGSFADLTHRLRGSGQLI